MHKIIGEFDETNLAFVLTLDMSHKVSKELYYKLKSYIDQNMFLGIRRHSPDLRRILITSIGNEKEGDVSSYELFVDVEVFLDSPDYNYLYNSVMKLSYWTLVAKLVNKKNKVVEVLTTRINKLDDLILERDLENVSNK